ncbi:hypothetical protein ACFVVX_11725 [Kitasatospora sp. NPDC058170]|uniref:hypothetical protein n=1 Tax=Kitasatospora sp. NPDC058170 TaxID=3346364 RepID=UPI0036DF2531
MGRQVDRDLVLRARVLLLSTDRRVVRGARGLAAYRLLAQADAAVYGSKLAYVLLEAARSPQVQDLPQARSALLEEAVAVARALEEGNPYRAKVLGRAREALQAEQARQAGQVGQAEGTGQGGR